MEQFINQIEQIWNISEINTDDKIRISEILEEIIQLLNEGKIRVAQSDTNGSWIVNAWIKKAILLYFRYNASSKLESGIFNFYDKIPLKFNHTTDFEALKIRAIPGAIVRQGAYIGKNTILMPSFVNIGAYIGDGTMVDTWVTIGSCAQIGKNCHISGGVGIGGVLEPIQASPVIIEDNVFVGARSEIAEGVVVKEGAVISMGVFLGASTRIYDRANDKIIYGEVPPFSVVVPGSLPSSDGKTLTYAAIIVKQADANTRRKTSLNELLRE